MTDYRIALLPDDGGAFYLTDDPAEVPALVYPYYCSLCNAINGGEADGEGDCEHKEEARRKLSEAQAKLAPEDVDARREDYYRAGMYPPNPVVS